MCYVVTLRLADVNAALMMASPNANASIACVEIAALSGDRAPFELIYKP